MSTQFTALRLADDLESVAHEYDIDRRAAAELRRLHEVNQELVEALERLVAYKNGVEDMFFAKAALAKARGME